MRTEDVLRAQALRNAARAALSANDIASLVQAASELRELGAAGGDPQTLGYGHYYAAAAAFWRNDARKAVAEYRSALEAFREAGDEHGMARAMLGSATTAVHGEMDLVKARQLYEEALPLVRALHDDKLLAETLGKLGEVCQFEADYATSERHTTEAITLYERLGMASSMGVQYVSLAHLQLLRRDYAASAESMKRAYGLLREDPVPRRVAWYLDFSFVFAAARSHWETAARLLGFTNRYRDECGVARLELTPWFAHHIERVTAAVGADRLDTFLAEGESLTLEDVPALVALLVEPGDQRP
ncbi:MAG: hypothetical protein JO199_14665 [Candidatus Eremiobacteraeota bacterium]|nr:hypothetical protein [Candidatus Eremiobacteraeota bacterium]